MIKFEVNHLVYPEVEAIQIIAFDDNDKCSNTVFEWDGTSGGDELCKLLKVSLNALMRHMKEKSDG